MTPEELPDYVESLLSLIHISFGKGLVQQPIDFSDGSAIRLTIARYYTPAGRCIPRQMCIRDRIMSMRISNDSAGTSSTN